MFRDMNGPIGKFQKDIVDLYPYPLARAYQRIYQANEPVSQHQLVLSLAETFLKYLAALCISQYVQDRAADPAWANARIDQLLNALNRPSLGDWNAFTRDILALYAGANRRNQLVLLDLIPFSNQKRDRSSYPAMIHCMNRLRTVLSPTEGGDVTVVSFSQLAQRLVTYRNRVAHGMPMTNPSICAERISWILPALEEALLAARFLTNDGAGLIYVQTAQLIYQRQIEHVLKSYTSTMIALPLPSYVTANMADSVEPQRLYISRPGEFPRPMLSLHPLLLVAICERSSEPHVFILNQADPGRIEYICTHCDWIYQPDRIRQDFDWLFHNRTAQPRPDHAGLTSEPPPALTVQPAELIAESPVTQMVDPSMRAPEPMEPPTSGVVNARLGPIAETATPPAVPAAPRRDETSREDSGEQGVPIEQPAASDASRPIQTVIEQPGIATPPYVPTAVRDRTTEAVTTQPGQQSSPIPPPPISEQPGQQGASPARRFNLTRTTVIGVVLLALLLTMGSVGIVLMRQVASSPVSATTLPATSNALKFTKLRTISARNVDAMTFSPDGHTLAAFVPTRSGSTIQLLNVSTGQAERAFDTPTQISQLAFSPDGQSLAGIDLSRNMVVIWRVSDGTVEHTFTDSQGSSSVHCSALSPDWKLYASCGAFAGNDYTIRVLSVSDGSLVRTLTGHTGNITDVAFAPDGQTLVSISKDRTMRLWISDGTAMRTIPDTFGGVEVIFSPDGQMLATIVEHGSIPVWRVSDGKLLQTIKDPENKGNIFDSIVFASGGQILVSRGAGGVRVWRVGDGSLLQTLSDSTDLNAVAEIAVSQDGQVWAVSYLSVIQLWYIEKEK